MVAADDATDKTPRRAIPKRLRYEILHRDNHACRYCGAMAPDVALTIDHVVPVVLGGSDDPSNLITACRDCNAGKSASSPDAPLVADVAQDALRWARAMEFASRVQHGTREERNACRESVDALWKGWLRNDDSHVPRPSDWALSVDRFYEAGLDDDDMEDLIESTMVRRGIRDEWAYFCGSAWRLIAQRQDIARQVLEHQDARPATDGPTGWGG